MELVIRICQWNCCQSFSENLFLGTLIICSVNALCIWDKSTFIKNFYMNYSFFNGIWLSICFKLGSIVTESNKCLFIFPPKKQIFYYLPDLRKKVFIWHCLFIFFSVLVKSEACYITGRWGASSWYNKRNLTLSQTLNILSSIVFHNKIFIFIMIFMAYSRLIFHLRWECQLDYMVINSA